MKPEVGKWYYVEYGSNVERAQCLAVTDRGGIFKCYVGLSEREEHRILAEAQPPEAGLIKRLLMWLAT